MPPQPLSEQLLKLRRKDVPQQYLIEDILPFGPRGSPHTLILRTFATAKQLLQLSRESSWPKEAG
eukprot:7028527-Pyramimonas_sp.AAC.1